MGMKMRMASKQDPIKTEQKIEESVKTELGKFKIDIEESIKKYMGTKGLQDTELKTKIAKIVEETQIQREKALNKADKEGVKCLTCGGQVQLSGSGVSNTTGHTHHETVAKGSRVKCVGEGCGKEYEMVDLASDLQCVGCGAPLKSDNVKNKDDGCPFCGSTKARKYNWTKAGWKTG